MTKERWTYEVLSPARTALAWGEAYSKSGACLGAYKSLATMIRFPASSLGTLPRVGMVYLRRYSPDGSTVREMYRMGEEGGFSRMRVEPSRPPRGLKRRAPSPAPRLDVSAPVASAVAEN